MRDILEAEKYPSTTDKHVGVELEFLITYDDIGKMNDALIKEGLHYNVSVTDDGSVRETDYVAEYRYETLSEPNGNSWVQSVIVNPRRYDGQEIRILAKESQVQDIVRKVCRILHKLDTKVNTTCGLHVHLDMRKRDKDQVTKNFFNCQTLLYSLVDKERKRNKFCRRLRSPTGKVTSRYYGINKLALERHGTMEIRMHQGTLKPSQINSWIQLLIGIADGDIKSTVTKVENLEVREKIKDFYKKVKHG